MHLKNTGNDLGYFNDKFISILIPAYNEEHTIEKVVKDGINALKRLAGKYQILVVDDGSTDSTGKILDRLARGNKSIRVIHFKKNMGIGVALYTLYKESKGDFVITAPADDQVRIKELLAMMPCIIDHDIVVGNRVNRADSFFRRFSSGIFSLALRLRFGLKVRDITSAKIYRKSVFSSIRIDSRTAFVDPEILIKAVRKRLRIIEVPIKHYPRVKGEAKGLSLKIIVPQLFELFRAFFRIRW